VQNVAGNLRQIVAGQFVKLTEYFRIVLRYKHQATSNKQQATSNKQQATSNKQQATSCVKVYSVKKNYKSL
jgi:hypothetical protein